MAARSPVRRPGHQFDRTHHRAHHLCDLRPRVLAPESLAQRVDARAVDLRQTSVATCRRYSFRQVHEPAPGVIACLGYNGRGIAMATAMGGEIARRITGTPAADLDMPVSPIRPIPFHGFWRLGAAARIAYGRARNALRV